MQRRIRSRLRISSIAALAIALVAGAGLMASAQTAAAHPVPAAHQRQSPDSGPAVHHDTSALTLRAMAAASGPAHGPRVAPDINTPIPHPAAANSDPVRQTTPGTAPNAATIANFNAIGSSAGYSVTGVPPDPNAAVGPTQIFETVNTAYAIYNKSGGTIVGATNTSSLWSGFGGFCQSDNAGDATVSYDRINNRWLVQQFANVESASGPYYECVAVSTSSDATGTYNRYSFQFTNFPDYPKTAVWPGSYFTTYNMFTAAGSFIDAEICAMDMAKMLTGAAASQQCFTTSSTYGGILASDLDGTTLPPSGENNTVIGLGATNTTLAAWRFHADWTTPANSTFTGPSTLTVASYTTACGTSGTCIPQGGTTQKLDSLSDRVMYRLAYRNFGDHEALVVNDAVTAGTSVGVRWYELRQVGNATPTVYQQGTYAPDSTYRWMGSIAQDKGGNIALGYSQSSSSTKPSIRFTGRAPGDPAGTMTQAETTVITGVGSQTSYSRWGDYTSMSVDPSDDCTFWFTDEYEPATGNFNWQTRIAGFQLPNCGVSTPDFSMATSPASGSVVQGSSTTTTVATTALGGDTESIALSASGLPSGATAGFSPASVTAGGSATLTLGTAATTPTGTYPITITGTGTSHTHTTTYTLTVTGPVTGGITNGGFETGSLSGWTATGASETVTNSGPHSGTYAAMLGSSAITNGASNVAQTFTAPTGTTTLGFWYDVICPDTVTYDWATATLKDNTTGTTTTVLAKTCVANSGWIHKTATIVAGHSYTLTLTSKDDNYPGDPTYTEYYDVTLS